MDGQVLPKNERLLRQNLGSQHRFSTKTQRPIGGRSGAGLPPLCRRSWTNSTATVLPGPPSDQPGGSSGMGSRRHECTLATPGWSAIEVVGRPMGTRPTSPRARARLGQVTISTAVPREQLLFSSRWSSGYQPTSPAMTFTPVATMTTPKK